MILVVGRKTTFVGDDGLGCCCVVEPYILRCCGVDVVCGGENTIRLFGSVEKDGGLQG